MRTTLALAGLAAAAAFAMPVAPASAVCTGPIIEAEGGGGGGQTCTNECYMTGEAYENSRNALVEKFPALDVVPSYWDLFACLDS